MLTHPLYDRHVSFYNLPETNKKEIKLQDN